MNGSWRALIDPLEECFQFAAIRTVAPSAQLCGWIMIYPQTPDAKRTRRTTAVRLNVDLEGKVWTISRPVGSAVRAADSAKVPLEPK